MRTYISTTLRTFTAAKLVAILGVAAAVVALLTGCSGLNGASGDAYAPVTAAAATNYQPTVAALTITGRVCADATGSTSDSMPQFGPTMRSDIAAAVRSWDRTAPTTLTAGTASQPGLALQIRWVNTDSLADANALNVSVPAVAGLISEPAVSDPSFVPEDQAWHTAAATMQSASAAAVRQAASAAASVSAFQWPDGNSGISSCISALIQGLPTGHTFLLVASDGEETEPPQIAGNLHGAHVLWVMPCPSGNADICTGLQTSWSRLLTRLGASSIRFVRPEDASAGLFATFMKGV